MSLINAFLPESLRYFRRVAIGGLAAAAFSISAEAHAQTQRKSATRAEIEEAAARAEQSCRSSKNSTVCRNAERVRARLRDGDFQPGHRILLSVYGDSTLSDTFTVRADRKLLLPNLPPVSMVGVLDSELEGFLQKELSAYLKNPTVRAQGLLRVSILGAVGQPGFYSFPLDFALADVIMEAGGPDGSAELNRTEIKRGGSVAVDKKAMQEAFRLGLTLNDVGVRPGDEMVIPSGGKSNWQRVATIAGIVTGLAWTVSALVR